jgi:type IV pilus assembly protein PilC
LPVYEFKARNPTGRSADGTIEADNERAAVAKIRARGLFVTSIRQDGREAAAAAVRAARRRRARGKVSAKDLSLFCRQFATMVGAGVAILTSLRILARQASSRVLAEAVGAVADDIEAGETLASAFHRQSTAFPTVLTNMVAAGEVGGILEEVFERMAEHFEKESAVTQKVKSAMTYPIAVVVVAVVIVVFLLVFVLPTFVGLFSDMGAALPLPTRILLALSKALRTRWYVFLVGTVGLALAFRAFARTEKGSWTLDRVSLKIPVFGLLVQMRAMARFSRTLATLIKSGVPILTSMAVTQRTVGNRVVADQVQVCSNAVRDGMSMTGPMRTGRIFPQMVIEMISVGEETGSIDGMLSKVADFYEREIDALVERFTSLLEPLIIVVLGVIVAFILLSIVMPMFQMFQMVG